MGRERKLQIVISLIKTCSYSFNRLITQHTVCLCVCLYLCVCVFVLFLQAYWLQTQEAGQHQDAANKKWTTAENRGARLRYQTRLRRSDPQTHKLVVWHTKAHLISSLISDDLIHSLTHRLTEKITSGLMMWRWALGHSTTDTRVQNHQHWPRLRHCGATLVCERESINAFEKQCSLKCNCVCLQYNECLCVCVYPLCVLCESGGFVCINLDYVPGLEQMEGWETNWRLHWRSPVSNTQQYMHGNTWCRMLNAFVIGISLD